MNGVPKAGDRNTIGGSPILAKNQSHPHCKECGARMVFFFQLDIKKEHEIPAPADSHLLVFMCPNHNDIPLNCSDGLREPEFWNKETGTFCLLLNDCTDEETVGNEEPFLIPVKLHLQLTDEQINSFDGIQSGEEQFKVGGVPIRINNKVEAICGCGANMSYICQLPENFGFPKKPDAPEQPDSFSSSEYCLFLGNIVYILGCDSRCNPKAVTAICDN